jgi:N-acetylmuramoyl-L-alanine amidase
MVFLFGLMVVIPAQAADWTLHRFEGREYISLDNIATFYELPAPPKVELLPPAGPTPAVPAVPSTTAPAPATAAAGAPPAVASGPIAATATEAIAAVTADAPGPIGNAEPPPATPASKTINLDSGKAQLEVTVGLREMQINGVKHWLAFPAHLHEGQVFISRLDLSKIIEPRMRPELIPGLQSFTTVVLDPGHGGHDRGAISKFGYEKDFALDVALRVRPLLERQGYKVVLTRSTDVFIPLDKRPAVANNIAGSIFVSIHFNSSTSNADARGFEIFSMAPRGAPATNDSRPSERDLRAEAGNAQDLPSGALAGSVYHSLLGHVPMVDRGVKHARFAVLRHSTVPAILVECGFVSNKAESTLISSSAWRANVAEAIVDGVENYKMLAEKKSRPKVIADYRRAAAAGGNSQPAAP